MDSASPAEKTERKPVDAYLIYGWRVTVGAMQRLFTEIGTDLLENDLGVVVVPGREIAVGYVLGRVTNETQKPLIGVPVPGPEDRARLLAAAEKARLAPIIGGRSPELVLVGDARR